MVPKKFSWKAPFYTGLSKKDISESRLNTNPMRCCNYCVNFLPLSNSPDSYICGVCHNYDGAPTALSPFSYSKCPFDRVACPRNFKHTIHNHFNLESPEYIKEYRKALKARWCLHSDILDYAARNTNRFFLNAKNFDD